MRTAGFLTSIELPGFFPSDWPAVAHPHLIFWNVTDWSLTMEKMLWIPIGSSSLVIVCKRTLTSCFFNAAPAEAAVVEEPPKAPTPPPPPGNDGLMLCCWPGQGLNSQSRSTREMLLQDKMRNLFQYQKWQPGMFGNHYFQLIEQIKTNESF